MPAAAAAPAPGNWGNLSSFEGYRTCEQRDFDRCQADTAQAKTNLSERLHLWDPFAALESIRGNATKWEPKDQAQLDSLRTSTQNSILPAERPLVARIQKLRLNLDRVNIKSYCACRFSEFNRSVNAGNYTQPSADAKDKVVTVDCAEKNQQ